MDKLLDKFNIDGEAVLKYIFGAYYNEEDKVEITDYSIDSVENSEKSLTLKLRILYPYEAECIEEISIIKYRRYNGDFSIYIKIGDNVEKLKQFNKLDSSIISCISTDYINMLTNREYYYYISDFNSDYFDYDDGDCYRDKVSTVAIFNSDLRFVGYIHTKLRKYSWLDSVDVIYEDDDDQQEARLCRTSEIGLEEPMVKCDKCNSLINLKFVSSDNVQAVYNDEITVECPICRYGIKLSAGIYATYFDNK